ncbi:hypothetical protein M378DRAFT_610832 [Amanita muscaria Koide BX008]|uniref:Uncharacterized protein n=1 Tax=Amanita muscaria (strain Koide BX008) TaxID=946122 RepID=A0A0C2T2V8_AMAMK|nr:hypothetical protein M378DRAFT_610832 [Amanita muscaria Koide BX008]
MSKTKPAFEHPSTGGDEDNADLETLQARIDMSMSYAQDLVSSWIEPNKVATTSRSYDVEKELKEYMKRPLRYEHCIRSAARPYLPRLGVGASIPEENNMSREEARLKGRLRAKMKTKRSFDEVDKRKSASDDEEESKAGVIKKKTKIDPFASMSRLNKKSRSHPSSRATPASQESTEEPFNVGGDVARKPSPVKPAVSPVSQLQDTGSKEVDSMNSTAAKLSKSEALDQVTQAGTAQVRQPSHTIEGVLFYRFTLRVYQVRQLLSHLHRK